MYPNTLKKLEQFIGHVCTIITVSMNRSFDERVARQHFAVRVCEIGMDGLWGTHPHNDELISFFALAHIVSIHREVELNPSNPEHAEMIAEFEKKSGRKIQPDMGKIVEKKTELPILKEIPPEETEGDSAFIDIANLEMLAEDSRRAFEAYDQHRSRK
jgi:hypothetical protein